MPYSSAIGPGYLLESNLNAETGEDELTGYVNGEPIGPFDVASGRMFTRLVGIPDPANPANLDVRSDDPRASVTLSGSTDPAPLRILADNSLSWTTGTGQTYRLDPSEYDQPTEPGGTGRGTGTCVLGPDGSWERVDPTTVPTVVGLWGADPPAGQGHTRWPDDGPDRGPDRGPGIDRRPRGSPDGGSGDPTLTPAGSGSTRASLLARPAAGEPGSSGAAVPAPERAPNTGPATRSGPEPAVVGASRPGCDRCADLPASPGPCPWCATGGVAVPARRRRRGRSRARLLKGCGTSRVSGARPAGSPT